MGTNASLLRPRRMRVGPRPEKPTTAISGQVPTPLPPAGPFRPQAASAGLLLGVEASARIRYTSLAALLKATPAVSLLAAQRQRLVTLRTSTDKGLRSAFLKLLDADILSAPVYDDASGEWVGFLDVRDLVDLVLLRYLWRRECASSTSPSTSTSTSTSAIPEHMTAPSPAQPPAQMAVSKATAAGAGSAGDGKQTSTKDTTLTAVAAVTTKAPGGSGDAEPPIGVLHVPDFIDDALTGSAHVKPTGMVLDISLRSLAERHPWRPLPAATATLFDVARELLTDARRVPIVDANAVPVGVVTQSAIIAFLSTKMTEISARGVGIRAPQLVTNTHTTMPAPAPATGSGVNSDVKAACATAGSHASDASKAAPVATADSASASSSSSPLKGLDLQLAETGHSAWQLPLSELMMPNTTGGSTAPSPLLGTCPVWTVPASTPLAEALWSMSEAATTSVAIADTTGSGGLVATLSAGDLKLFLKQMRKRFNGKSGGSSGGGSGGGSGGMGESVHSDFTDALLEGDVLEFVRSVRRADDFEAFEQMRKVKSSDAKQQSFAAKPIATSANSSSTAGLGAESSSLLAHHLQAAAPVVSVGTNASLAHVVHRLAASRAHKCYVVGATAPFVPLRVISLTDILRYVVAADEAAATTAAAIAAAEAAATTATVAMDVTPTATSSSGKPAASN